MKIDADLDKRMAEVDFSNGKTVNEVPALKAYQEQRKNKAEFLENQQQFFGFEKEVANWLSMQDIDTKDYINGVIKNYMDFKSKTMLTA